LDLQRSYKEDLRLFKKPSGLVAFLVLVVSLLAFPLVALKIQGGAYYVNVVNLVAINAIVSIGLNILVGYTGQASLGHAGFFAIGAYAQAMLVTQTHLPLPMALIAAGLLAAVAGVLLGLPALRLEGPYLAIATLGFGMAVTQIIGRLDFLGGRDGLSVPGPAFVPPLKRAIAALFSSERAVDAPHYAIYLLAMPLCVLLTIAAVNLMKSKVGRAFVAIRDSDIAAETIGINLTRYKTGAFAVSAFYTGLAGGLYAHAMGFIDPGSFDLRMSIAFLAMVVVGGLGSVLGSHLGAILMTLLPLSLTAVQNIPEVIYGAVMILVILFEPLGLRGRWLKMKLYWKMWPF
jgi:branched-chain amino acid transport system permease protein